ncbi:uncharacterized protein BKCO1_7100036 [Diplodia corticola]|uniref:Uncharacterized protein n=1 Tax=Diplodia corticola TaxID=236234 RepID=A0A1J9RMW8_9PEZI|nr:uncharacterized protein BKCO1_7100036 [Diplodia corticola]OJD29855.1 hypothetical protein BKCO1_7100036 [Diplodia corticola]
MEEEAGPPARRLTYERIARTEYLCKCFDARPAISSSTCTTPLNAKPTLAVSPATSSPLKRKRPNSLEQSYESCESVDPQEVKTFVNRIMMDAALSYSAPQIWLPFATLQKTHSLTPTHDTTPVMAQDSPFLKLPAGIRNEIYRHVLCPESPGTPLKLRDAHTRFKPKPKPQPKELPQFWNPAMGLLRVCKQLHQEAGTFLYSNNHFWGDDGAILKILYAPNPMVPRIRHLSMSNAGDLVLPHTPIYYLMMPVLSELSKLPDLEKLELHMDRTDRLFQTTPMKPREFARAVYWGALSWVKEKRRVNRDLRIADCIHIVFPHPSPPFDQDMFREEFSYFVEIHAHKLHYGLVIATLPFLLHTLQLTPTASGQRACHQPVTNSVYSPTVQLSRCAIAAHSPPCPATTPVGTSNPRVLVKPIGGGGLAPDLLALTWNAGVIAESEQSEELRSFLEKAMGMRRLLPNV